MGNFVIFGIFKQALSQDGVINVGKGYKFSWFSPRVKRKTLYIASTVTNFVDFVFLLQYRHLIFLAQHDCQPFPPRMKSNAFGVLTLFVILGNFCNFLVYLSTRCPKMK